MKAFLLFLGFIYSMPAYAGWLWYAENGSAQSYFDPSTIKRKGSIVHVWNLQDLKQRNQNGEMSAKFLTEIDCKGARFRVLSFSAYAERMAGGKVLASGFTPGPLGKWEYYPPDSPAAAINNLVCQRNFIIE